MIDVLEKPIISKEFTIDDIHKIREYNYEITKDMTIEERINYINKRGKEAAIKHGLKLKNDDELVLA